MCVCYSDKILSGKSESLPCLAAQDIHKTFFSAPRHYTTFTFRDSFTLKSLWFVNYIKQSYYFTVITSSKSLQAKISSSNSIFMKRYVNTSSTSSPGVSYIFLAVKHLRMGAKQEPYMPLSECETLNSVPKRGSKSNYAAPANICVAALHCQQQNWDALQHIHLLFLNVKHFIS